MILRQRNGRQKALKVFKSSKQKEKCSNSEWNTNSPRERRQKKKVSEVLNMILLLIFHVNYLCPWAQLWCFYIFSNCKVTTVWDNTFLLLTICKKIIWFLLWQSWAGAVRQSKLSVWFKHFWKNEVIWPELPKICQLF